MFLFWTRKGNKSPFAGRSTNTSVQPEASPESSKEVPQSPPVPRGVYPTSLPSQDNQPGPSHAPSQNAPSPIVNTAPNPHDDAILEVEARLSEAERLASAGTQPAHDAADNSMPEPLYDPATGVQHGVFESVTYADNDLVRNEVWSHLARMRELQSSIAKMHMNLEGLGEGPGSMSLEVDADIDIETVPTQEEEDAARRQREFERLPEKFKGREDEISAMMAKLDELSQAVNSFHALQPPPLRSESHSSSQQNTHDATTSPSIPTSFGPILGPIVIPGEKKFVDILHDSPTSHQSP